MRLSEAQQGALLVLREHGPLDDFWACIRLGRARKQILKALRARGLARWCPYGGEGRRGHWKITAEGTREANDIDALQAQAEHQTRTDEMIRRNRELPGGE